MQWIKTIPPASALRDLATLIDKMHAVAHATRDQIAVAPNAQEARQALMGAYTEIDDLVILLKTKLSIAYSVAALDE